MYSLTTNFIKVTVTPYYLESRSVPIEELFCWAYNVTIENIGPDTVQLLNRHWIITDAKGLTKEVKGAGVIGEQPILKPGQKHEYTSSVPLNTQSGLMTGTYQMIKLNENEQQEGSPFKVDIPAFSLDTPEQLLHPN